MPEVTVVVNGRPYKMACDTGEEEQLKELAAFVDTYVADLKVKFGEAGENRLQVMTSLMIADKLNEAVRKIEAMQAEIDGLKDARAAAIERARNLEATITDKLDHAAAKIERLCEEADAPAS